MTDLRLTPDDQHRLAAALGALLAPLDYPDADAWRRDVIREAKPLFRAPICTFILPLDGHPQIYSNGWDVKVDGYFDHLDPWARRVSGYERMRRLGVADRRTVWGPHLDELYRSSYWREFLRPARAFDSLTLSAAVGPRPSLDDTAQLVFNHDAPGASPFGERGLTLGRLLLPALRTGALTWLRLHDARPAFAVCVDALALPLLLCDVEGRELHRNTALVEALGDDPEAASVIACAHRLARSAGRLATACASAVGNAAADGMDDAVEGGLQTKAAAYRLRATRLGAAVTGHRDAVAVTLERRAPSARLLPSEQELEECWGLTPQQARVALLLAERKTNAEIAEALTVSPHTARHHTEAVLAKLGLRDRRDVAALIRE